MHELVFRYRVLTHHSDRGFPLPLSAVSLTNQLVTNFSEIYSTKHDRGSVVLRVKSGVERPSLSALSISLQEDAFRHGRDEASSSYELLAAVLARGECEDYYGSQYWDSRGEAVHLLLCGIDWSRYRGVRDAQWSSFDGTFAESDRKQTMIEAQLQCRCDEELQVRFGLEPPSTASLFAALSTETLGRLFEV